jgi:hypothetical protein
MADKKLLNKQIPSSMTYPNPYAEGEFFTPNNVQLGQETIRKNIPLGIGMPQSIPPQAMPSDNVIRNAGLRMLPEEPVNSEDDTNFLGSLIAQGVAGIGTGLMGGTPRDIANSANMFQYMRDQQTKRNKSDLLMDPKSEESKKRRLVFKNLGYDVPEDLSYTDLGDSDVLRSLRSRQMEQPKLVGSTRQGGVSGVGQIKEEKRKDPTEAERLSLGFAKRTESSNKMLNNLEDKFLNKEDGFSPSSQFPYAPERFKSSERKNYEAAQKDFIGAVLRKESGASISDEEFSREAEKFFPLPGDNQENIQFKQLLRKQAINNLKTSANIRYVNDNQTGETVEIDPFGNVLRRYKE